MKDEDWVRSNRSYRTWIYYEPFRPNRWTRNTAVIVVEGSSDWQLHINNEYTATFNSWEEARDATPMMLALYEQGRSQ